MAVFSYVTGSNNSQSFLISSYADEIISSYANVLISEFEIKIITRSFKFSSNLKEEFVSSYNEFSRVDYLEITYGSITDSITDSEDYGYITGDIITYDQIENFGTITINRTQTPYGRLHIFQEFSDDSLSRVSVGGVRFALYGRANYEVIFNPLNRAFEIEGSADVPFTKSYVGKGQFTSFIGTADSVGFNPPESALLFRFQGKAETEVIFNERSRILYFDSATEVSKTNNYNETSVVTFSSTDYGLISEVESLYENYGLISEDEDFANWEREDFGFITENETRLPYGKTEFISYTTESTTNPHIGSGSTKIYGEGLGRATPRQLGEGFITLSGTSVDRFRLRYFGSGSAFTFVSGSETTKVETEQEGTIRFTGEAVERYTKGNYNGQSNKDIAIKGVAICEVIFNPIDRFARFLNLEINSRTYSYNESSVVNLEGIDYGFIAESPTLFGDYGNITDLAYYPWEEDDYGFITDNTVNLPFGKATFISGTTESNTENYVGSGSVYITANAKIFVLPKHNGSGIARFIGSAIEKNTEDYVGSGSIFTFVSATESETNAETSKELFQFNGSSTEKFGKGLYTGSGSIFAFSSTTESTSTQESSKEIFRFVGSAVEKNTESYVGSGSLFTFFTNQERVTYSYNESSAVRIDSIDYGFINEIPTYFDDYDEITGNPYYPWQRDDYGFITDNQTILPFGKTTFISGTTESNTENYVGSGSIFVSGTANVFVLPKHTGSGYAQFSGEAVEKNTEDYVGSGSIFTFVSFTESSSTAETSKELFQFNGSATEKFGKGLYTGSGSIFAFSSTTESESNTQESKGLFKFYGSATDSNTEDYVGSGSLFSFSTNKERVTYSYNQSSVYTFESLDYGFIIESPTLFGDYGSITENPFVPYPENSDYGFITDNQTRIPYGSLNISGTLDSIKIRLNYFGSGSINIDGNAEYAYTPEETGTGLFNITSNPIIKISLLHVGSGSLFSFVGGDESATPAPEIGSGTISIFGSAVERNTESYFGTGTLFGLSSTTEAYSFVPTTEGLFRISGSAAESTTPTTEIGSGSIFTFVSSTETFIVNPPDQTTLFSLSGSAVERNTESYFGTGTLFGFSSTTDSAILAESGSGLFRISGSAAESTTPTTEIGSGSIFTFVSATETFAINPPDQTTLFTLFGSAVEKNTESYFGTGTLFGFSSTTDSAILAETGTGLFKFYGSATDSNTESYVGTGVAFAFLEGVQLDSTGKIRYVSGQESTTSIPPTFGTLFSVSGEVRIFFEYRETGSGVVQFGGAGFAQPSAKHFGSGQIKVIGNTTESTKVDRSGSGSIFGFVSATESSIVNPPESTELFRISGTSIEKYTSTSDTIAEIAINGSAKIRRVPSVISKGKLTLSGYGEESFVLAPYSGSGRISTIGSSSDYRTVINPPEVGTIVLFRGTATTRGIINYTGSGSIFTFVSSTKTKSSTEKSEELFRITGSAVEKNTESYIGVGNLFEFSQRPIIDSNGKVSYVAADESSTGVPPTQIAETRLFGSADVRKTPSYVGSGSIFGFISKTESFGANPPESTELFKISGNSIEKNTEAYSGTGSIFSFASSAESISIRTTEPTSLFRISGGASKFSITRGRYVGSGSIFTFISSSESTLVSPQSSGLFDISGSARIRSIKSEFGTGSIFAFSSSTESLLKKYPDSVGLFNITGFAFESFATSTYLGDSQTIIRGSSVDRKTDYVAPKPVRLYII
jgi:hypothetical protein